MGMTTYRSKRLRRKQRRARLSALWDLLQPAVFVTLVVLAVGCVLYLGRLAGLVD